MNRKQEIVNALLEKIEDGGLNVNFTISELAKTVDIGKSTIYEYFDTKEAIIEEAVNQIVDNALTSVFEQKNDMNAPFERAFKDMLKFMFDLACEKSYMTRFLQLEYQESLPKMFRPHMIKKLNDVRQFYEQKFTALIQKGIEEGVLKIDYDQKKAFMIQAIVAGGIMRFMNVQVDNNLSVDDTIDAIYEAIIKVSQ
jgi:AcrR family transcriptional regulator